jgi:hypothetical protein
LSTRARVWERAHNDYRGASTSIAVSDHVGGGGYRLAGYAAGNATFVAEMREAIAGGSVPVWAGQWRREESQTWLSAPCA